MPCAPLPPLLPLLMPERHAALMPCRLFILLRYSFALRGRLSAHRHRRRHYCFHYAADDTIFAMMLQRC